MQRRRWLNVRLRSIPCGCRKGTCVKRLKSPRTGRHCPWLSAAEIARLTALHQPLAESGSTPSPTFKVVESRVVLQMARTVPSLISRRRCTLEIFRTRGFDQTVCAPPSRTKTQSCCLRWRSSAASFMLRRDRSSRAPHRTKDFFPQARVGTRAPA